MNILRRSAAVTRPRSGPAALPRRIEPKLVEHLPLLGVRKNFVRFLDLLEFFFRGFVAGIQVGMIFTRKFTVSRANILYGRLARHVQQFVIILFWRISHFRVSLRRCPLSAAVQSDYRFAHRAFHSESS